VVGLASSSSPEPGLARRKQDRGLARNVRV
jgi:hypothetical protein